MTENQIERVIVGPIHTNCYLVTREKQTLIIDPGAMPEKIIQRLTELRLTPVAVVNTHGHWDHLMADSALQKHYNIPIYAPAADQELIEKEKEHYQIGELAVDNWYTAKLDLAWPLKIIQTPGHTPGSSCLLLEQDLFAGDTMFAGGYLGRTDFWGGDAAAMQRSLAKLLALPDDTVVWPGHDTSSTIGQEREFYDQK